MLEWVAISFSNAWKWKVKVKSLSCVRLLASPWTAAQQARLSMGFSRQEYWTGLPFPSPSGPISSWQIDGKTLETVTDFFSVGSRITAEGNCNHEIKSSLLFEWKAVANLCEWSCSVVSDSLRPCGLLPTRLLCPWDSPGKNTGIGCHFLLQGIFPTQGLNLGILHCRQMLYPLSHQGSPSGKPIECIKEQRHYFADRGPYGQSYGFSSSHVWMWELEHKKGWVLKYWCFQTVVLEKTPESPLDCKEIKPVNPKGNQPWIFIGRTDAEAPILWPLDAKSQLIRKRPWYWETLKAGGEGDDRGRDGWMTSLTVHEFE